LRQTHGIKESWMNYHLEKLIDSNQVELLYLPRMADKTIDLTHEVVQAHYFEKYLAKVIEWLFANNPNLKRPTPQEQERMRTAAARELEEEYSQSGVTLTD
jgi:hypothetical protein